VIQTDWQRRRTAFNHDWLKNVYVPALEKWLNLLDDEIEDKVFEQAFVAGVLPAWGRHQEEAQALVGDFENALSPRRLFDLPPLARCGAGTKSWLGDVMHGLWHHRSHVRDLLRAAEEASDKVESSYRYLQQELEGSATTKSAEALRPLKPQFESLVDGCSDLAQAISKFPAETKVT